MAGYGSGTGSSAMLTVGLVIGQSCRWSFDQAADAMGCLLAKDRESSPSDHFLIFFWPTRNNTKWKTLALCAYDGPCCHDPGFRSLPVR